MIMHMSRVKNNNLYKECFHLPLEYEEKETLQNLLEIKGGSVSSIESDGKEMIAEKSKEEGNFYCNLKQHKKALEAYTFGLQSTDSEDLKHQIRLNICRVFYSSGQYEKCIKEVETILRQHPQDSRAFPWLALAYQHRHKSKTIKAHQELWQIGSVVSQDIARTFGALALFYSNNQTRVEQQLTKRIRDINQMRVIPVASIMELRKELTISDFDQSKRIVILLKKGIYNFSEVLSFGYFYPYRSIVCGEFGNQKPTFEVSHRNAMVTRRNIFINVHFQMNGAQLMVVLGDPKESPLLFQNCSFQSYCPLQTTDTNQDIKDSIKLLEKRFSNNNLTEEEYEKKELSEEERDTLTKEGFLLPSLKSKTEKMPAAPAVVVVQGICAAVKCEIFNCLGAGILVANVDKNIKELLLYIKDCTIICI